MADGLNLRFRITRRGPKLTELAAKVYAPALADAINKTILAIQEHTREQLPSRFILRTTHSRKFLEKLVSISRRDFASASQRRFRGVVRIGATDGASEQVRRFAPRFTRFEFGGVERSSSGRPLYVPTRNLRPSVRAIVDRPFYPKNLGLAEYRQIEGGSAFHGRGKSRKAGVHSTASGKLQLKGKRRTFAIDPRFSPGATRFGIWHRVGSGGATYKWWNYTHAIRYPKRLSFREDSRRIHQEQFRAHLEAALESRLVRQAVRKLG